MAQSSDRQAPMHDGDDRTKAKQTKTDAVYRHEATAEDLDEWEDTLNDPMPLIPNAPD